MRIPTLVLLVSTLTLAACGQSRLNPTTWFNGSGRAESTETTLIPRQTNLMRGRDEAPDTRVAINSIATLQLDQTPSGAIITATGIANRLGAFNAALRPRSEEVEPDENGELVFDFVLDYPSEATARGSEQLRTITAAYSISRQTLEEARVIRVTAAQNAREVRRR